MSPQTTVFVCAATGTQGGAVARQLRAIGWDVRTTTRSPHSPAAQALTAAGVKVYQASWSDTAVLESAIAGSSLLFLNLMPAFANPPSEFDYGQNILRIAKAAGVTHVVYSSGYPLLELDRNDFRAERADIFKAKMDLERGLQTAGFTHWTILQPSLFMANFLLPRANFHFASALETGEFVVAYRPDTYLPLVDHEDIAAFAVAAFQQPAKFHGHAIKLISENVPFAQAVETVRRAIGRNLRARYLTDEEVQQAVAQNPGFPLLKLHQVWRDIPVPDPAEVKAWGVPTGTFEQFVSREKEEFEQTYRKVEKKA